MADDINKKQKEKENEEANKQVQIVCTLNFRQILIALHEKALSQVKNKELLVQNSAIEGNGGKNAKFYGAGEHLIAAIPADQKGLDNNKVEKKDALEALTTYIQWFVGPDLKTSATEKDLKPLENGAEGQTKNTDNKKEDIEKSKGDKVAGEKYKENKIFIPSFSQYLLTEAGEEDKKSEEDDKKESDDKEQEELKKTDGVSTAPGWYINYRLKIPGQKEHPIAQAMKQFAGDLIKNVGVKFTSLFGGGDGKTHTIGDLVDGLDAIFGKLDPDQFLTEFNNELKKKMKQTNATGQIFDTKTITKFLKQRVSKYKSQINAAEFALCVRVAKNDKSYKLFNEDTIANIVNTSIKGALRGIMKKIQFGVKAKDVILVNNYEDEKKDRTVGEVADSKIQINKKPLIIESKKYIKKVYKTDIISILNENYNKINEIIDTYDFVKTNNSLLSRIFVDLDESLLLEGHSEEQLAVEKEIDRIGVENLTKNVDELRKNYLEHLKQVKAKNSKDEYVQKIEVNSKNWISKEFIGKLRDQEKATTDTIKKMLKDCVSRVGKTDSKKFELHALVDAMKKLPDGPKKDEEDEENNDEEKITITFRDVDDPSQLESPEEPTDKDKEQYKTIGEPLELIPGEDVKIPEVKNKGEKGEWEFMGFDPDPENMDESGYTYATYTTDKPDTVKITFYDADPETGEKLKEPLGDPIEIPSGKAINGTDEGTEALEKYNKQLEDDKKDGYVFKGWNPDPSTNVKEDTDVVAKYIEEGEKDTEYTVMFQYAPDQEKPNDTEIIQIDGEDEQKVKAGEAAKRPEEMPEIEGYTFIDFGEDEEALNNVQDDIVAVANYKKTIKIIPKAPKDPKEPDKDLEPIGEPIIYDPEKNLEEELPEPPEKDGWEPTGKWNPDPKTIKDPEEDIDIIPEYKEADKEDNKNNTEKTFIIKIILPDPEDPDNPKKYDNLASIYVVKGLYKPNDLTVAEKNGTIKSEDITFVSEKNGEETTKKLSDIINDNKSSFANIDNINDIQKRANEKAGNQDNTYKFKEWDKDIEQVAKDGPDNDGNEVIIKPVFSNDANVNHTDIDFYIIPMKGLKNKESKTEKK